MGKYVPETSFEQEEMLKEIGLNSIDDLFKMVPEEVNLKELNIPEGKSELEVANIMNNIASIYSFKEANGIKKLCPTYDEYKKYVEFVKDIYNFFEYNYTE